jgi:hypothetical protein
LLTLRRAGRASGAVKTAAAQRIVGSFRVQNKAIDCRAITGIDLSSPKPGSIARFLIKSAPTGSCFGMSARCARAAFGEINTALSGNLLEVPSTPLSCTAMLARKMGVPDLQVVMVAGLAGGIGLSGSACGALGAAIWFEAMNSLKAGGSGFGLNDPRTRKIVDRFAQCSGHEFECSKIVGRKFESLADHAAYMRSGGCSKILEGLVT